MRAFQLSAILVSLLLVTSLTEAKRKKHKSAETKTKTKWSTSTDLGSQAQNSMVAAEEHGYYVKRTFLPLNGDQNSSALKSPPFLAVPIAWFPCVNAECVKLNSLTINSNKNSLAGGFLCDDDCDDPYEPICGKTYSEVAVFYNECKLKVAKCRTHGFWTDIPYEECKTQYPDEVKYADMKFRANPYFKEKAIERTQIKPVVLVVEPKPAEKEIITISPTITTTKPVETTTATIMIKEIQEKEPQEKLKESKDHYQELKKDIQKS